MFDFEKYRKRVAWYQKDRFGMFIHWGIYSTPARGEWVRSIEKISVEDYQPYFDNFDPVDYDPKKWAKIAKEAGMKYAVLTAKHHDGFCLFDSKLTDYKSTNTKAKRDLVREYLEAFRAEGIKVGLYYSLIDWPHEDFPHFGDKHHPMRNNENYKNDNRNFDNYLDYMHGQVKELCTEYGKLDLMWFDFSYDNLQGEKWRASELVKTIRTHQPDIILDNRLEVSGSGFGSLITENPSDFCGDFVSPEQIIPPKGIVDYKGDPVVWEACITMNNNWGYNEKDHYYKPYAMLIRKLVECVSKGGNLLLNVGPDAKGNIPDPSIRILKNMGDWMKKNSESIYNCTFSNVEKPEFGRITQNKNVLYFHVFDNPIGFVPLTGVKRDDIKFVQALHSGAELPIIRNWITDNYPDITFVSLGDDPVMVDEVDTVIKVTLKD